MKNSEINNIIEKKIIPAWLREAGFDGCYLYQGSSMKPTFLPGQLLYIRSEKEKIIPGDIIVYRELTKKNVVVHRVVSTSLTGFITRGDNNSHFDRCPVEPKQIIGRVEIVEDRDHIRAIPRGRFPLFKKRIKWGLFKAGKLMGIVLKGPYTLISKSKLIRNVLNKWFSHNIKIILIKTPEGQLYKVMYKKRNVCQWWPENNRFFCQKPFDLFISPDEIRRHLNK